MSSTFYITSNFCDDSSCRTSKDSNPGESNKEDSTSCSDTNENTDASDQVDPPRKCGDENVAQNVSRPEHKPNEGVTAVTKITKDVQFGNDCRIELDEGALSKVLKNPKWENYYVAVYAIAGPSRSGKSFLLNLLYHYFKVYYKIKKEVKPKSKTRPEGQLHSLTEFDIHTCFKDEIEKAFEWKSGLERHTDGIYILSKPILIPQEYPEIAIFLMDTIGLFDNQTSVQNLTTIGTLSFLLSSFQMFNVKEKIDSTHLEHIYKFNEISRRLQENVPAQKKNFVSYFKRLYTSHSYQNEKKRLMFIVRDWEEEEYYELGLQGGKKYVSSLLKVAKNQEHEKEHALMREFMKEVFSGKYCTLLPHPGPRVKKGLSQLYLKELDKEFVKEVDETFQSMFLIETTTKIPVVYFKQMDGMNVTCRGLYHYVKKYAKVLQEGVLLDIENYIQKHLESKLKQFTLDGFEDFKKYLPEKVEKIEEPNLSNHVEETKKKFDSKIPEHVISSFREEWIKEFRSLLLQVVTANKSRIQRADHGTDFSFKSCDKDATLSFKVILLIETGVQSILTEVDSWCNENISKTQILSEEEKKKTREKRKEILEDLNIMIDNTAAKLYENPFVKSQTSEIAKEMETDCATRKSDFKSSVIKDLKVFYRDYLKKYINNKAVVDPQHSAKAHESSVLDLSLTLGYINTRSYEDVPKISKLQSDAVENDLGLTRFMSGFIIISYSIGKVSLPLYCNQA